MKINSKRQAKTIFTAALLAVLSAVALSGPTGLKLVVGLLMSLLCSYAVVLVVNMVGFFVRDFLIYPLLDWFWELPDK